MENYTQIQFVDTFGQVGPQGIIDVSTNVQMSINFAVGDIKDPFAKKGIKSYKFNIPGNKSNNLLLNNYFDVNILDGTYDHNKKQKVVILRNGIIVLDNAYMQLLQINKVANDTEFSDQLVSYDVEIGNDTTSFFTDITNKYLSDLDFSDMNHNYDSTQVVASFTNTAGPGAGWKYVLPYISGPSQTALPHTGTQYALEECRPSISVYEYWNRIHQNAGYQWEWVGFNTDSIRMNKLFIPYNGDKPVMSNQLLFEVAAEKIVPFTANSSPVPGFPGTIFPVTFIANVEIVDNLGLYDPILGIYTANLYSGTSALDVSFKVNYTFNLINPSGGTAYLSTTGATGLPSVDKQWEWHSVARLRNTNTGLPGEQAFFSVDTIITTPTVAYSVPSGTTTLSSGTFQTNPAPITGVSFGDQIISEVLSLPYDDGTLKFKSSVIGGTFIAVRPQLVITSIEMIIIPRIDTYCYNTTINMNDFVPQKIKQSDFIKAIANMYNLVIDVDPFNDKKIIYKTRDNYYDQGAIKDWTKKFVADKENNLTFISNSNSKKIILTYKPDKDAFNVDYLSAFKENYGQLEYILENENIKGLENKEILFSPTGVGLTQFGAYTPFIDGFAPKNNIRILLDGGVQPTGLGGTQLYDIIDYNYNNIPPQHSDSGFGLNTYPMLTHMDNPDTPQFDINFGLCDSYYFPFTSQTNNNLYSLFWRRTISQIDSGKLLTAYFYLSEYDISLLKLNDKIWVKDAYYNINTLQYDPNSFGPTKVVLMTIDDKLKLLPPSQTHIHAKQISVGSKPALFQEISRDRYNHLNWVYADGSVAVLGVGNIVSADLKNILIVGDNKSPETSNSISTDNIYTTNLSVNGLTISSLPFINGIGSESAIQVNTLFPNDASGIYSLSIGTMSVATGDSSFAGGGRAGVVQNGGIATGAGSFAFGANATATGLYSFCIGATVAVGNGATAAYAFAGGYDCKASAGDAFAFGFQTLASGAHSVAMGSSTQATVMGAAAFGNLTQATGPYSMSTGQSTQATGLASNSGGIDALASHYCEWARGSGSFSGSPDSQYGFLSALVITPNATPIEIWLDGVGQRFTIPGSSTYRVEITCVAVDHNVNIGDSACFSGVGLIKNVGGTTSLVGAITMTQEFADASMVATAITVTADDPNDALSLFATGIAATVIYWSVSLKYVKVAF